MWNVVLSFALRPKWSAVRRRGVLTHVDPTISTVRVAVDDGSCVDAVLDRQDCTDALRDVVRTGGGEVRVEVDVDRDSVVALHVAVLTAAFDAAASEGRLACEEHLVTLARTVWREARVPPPPDDGYMSTSILLPLCPAWGKHPLHAHQRRTVAWMREQEEEGARRALSYEGNLRLTDAWYVDTESDCLTPDPSWREADLAGGIVADGTGTGKTATMLRLLFTPSPSPPTPSSRYEARGTLVLLPLNLVAQWQMEVQKFLNPAGLRVVSLVQGKDCRSVTLRDLCEADVVFTTFYFLRASKPYAELVDTALAGRPRSRAVIAAWARAAGREAPVLEAVHWRRVVVDEIHQVFGSARDLRQLRIFRTRALWGLSATPELEGERAQHLYLLLRREKAHHPNLLARLISRSVRCGTADVDEAASPRSSLCLVQVSAEERLHLNATSSCSTEEEVVKRTTFVEVSDPHGPARDDETLEAQFRAARERELATLRATVEGHERAVHILGRAGAELEAELQALAGRCASGDPLARAQAEAARLACESHTRDLAHAVAARDEAAAKVARCEASAAYVRSQLDAMRRREEECSICMERTTGCITPCAHLFCSACVRRHLQTQPWCPTCRTPLQASQLSGVAFGIGTKMAQIHALLGTLRGECVVLFVQWKAMMRGVRAFLRGRGLDRVFLLDGNAGQRTATLSDFLNGGVLMLCLEDSFAGLHLPHARHVIFAHAIVGDQDRVARLEEQAVARCLRHGQTGEVRVHSFVVADCAEEDVWRRTHP